jgi:hypothetical protein
MFQHEFMHLTGLFSSERAENEREREEEFPMDETQRLLRGGGRS